jgi:hypothetical protein
VITTIDVCFAAYITAIAVVAVLGWPPNAPKSPPRLKKLGLHDNDDVAELLSALSAYIRATSAVVNVRTPANSDRLTLAGAATRLSYALVPFADDIE